jgi:hypothetical protein
MVNFIDKNMSTNIIILAGYEKEMREFFSSNQGLERRFPYIFILENYSAKELANICVGMIEDKINEKISVKTKNLIYSLIYDNEIFFTKQAGDCLNISDTIVNEYFLTQNLKKSIFISFKKFINKFTL